MAIKLKEGKTFSPPVGAQYGLSLGSHAWYGVIDLIEYNKQERSCSFSVEIFADSAARGAGASPVERMNYGFHAEMFDSEIGNDGLTIPQAYEKALLALKDWESDE